MKHHSPDRLTDRASESLGNPPDPTRPETDKNQLGMHALLGRTRACDALRGITGGRP
jgi:hypothetical protein